MFKQHGHSLLAVLVVLAASPRGFTQREVLRLSGPPSSSFGNAVDVLGDVDGDGTDDFLVGQFTDPSNADRGRVGVYSGSHAGVLLEVFGDQPADGFGLSVTGLGDVTGDSIPDFAVGAPSTRIPLGPSYVRVFSGRDGSVVHTLASGPAAFGRYVDGLGDVDGDGFGDFIIGTPKENSISNPSLVEAGVATVHSGATGAILFQFSGASNYGHFGACVSAFGDVQLDGHADFIIGQPDAILSANGVIGFVGTYSGRHGGLMREVRVPFADDHMYFGYDTAPAGDLNGDGRPDFLATRSNWHDRTLVTAYSGWTAKKLFEVEQTAPSSHFGVKGSMIGGIDLTGDGRSDILLGETFGSGSPETPLVRAFAGNGLFLDMQPRTVRALDILNVSLTEPFYGQNYTYLIATKVDGLPIAPIIARYELILPYNPMQFSMVIPPGLAGSIEFIGVNIEQALSPRFSVTEPVTVTFQ